MKASDITNWPDEFKLTDWPVGTVDKMDADLFYCLFRLRKDSGVPMWPSAVFGAHVRNSGNSQHSIKNGTRLSTATDMHVKTIIDMLHVMNEAEGVEGIGGIGIYFDTNTPMIHIDTRKKTLMWLRTKKGKYVYRENGRAQFYLALSDELQLAGY